MAKKPYKIVELAKEYLSRGLGESTPADAVRGEHIQRMLTKRAGATSIDNAAMCLLGNSLIAVARETGTITYDEVSAEIDRRIALVTEGWVKTGDGWCKNCGTPAAVMEFTRVLKEMGIGSDRSNQSITDFTEEITLKDEEHQALYLLLEGRTGEIER